MSETLDGLIRDFRDMLRVDWQPPADLVKAARAAIVGCAVKPLDQETRNRRLLAIINEKFRLNKDRFQNILDAAALNRVFPNYHQKAELLRCLDENDSQRLCDWLKSHGLPSHYQSLFEPVSTEGTLHQLAAQLKTPRIMRRDARKCHPLERRQEILRALFGCYVFRSFPTEAIHGYFNPDCRAEYYSDYYSHLARFHSSVLHRDCALAFLVIDHALQSGTTDGSLHDRLYAFIREIYCRLSNHCYLAILIQPFHTGCEDGQWRLFSDLVLYAEKHREVPLKTGYFQPQRIEQATLAHIPKLDRNAARFDLANEGFFYRDCFVLPNTNGEAGIQTTDTAANILLMFEKNEREETLIPCPACRSRDVSGNSYPMLGVRSWECQNPICPERSAFDRGNRYSLAQLIKQEAIKSDDDQIPESSLRKWKLDVVPGADSGTIAEMLLRHFTLHGDTILFINAPNVGSRKIGRHIRYEPFGAAGDLGLYHQFQRSALFHRFVQDRPAPLSSTGTEVPTGLPDVKLIQGDCFEVLSQMPAECINGAVTSPPYYNARNYSIWPNIYCYLYDMYNSARQVYRVLKAGGVYLFNVFDYFDNENSVALSAMGRKRMILGAYLVNLFRRIGFHLDGNTVWYKGEIEGKRNFNQGNRSPYYQFPLNCWEHIFAFRKPGRPQTWRFPQVLAAQPVIKMVRGENVLGHSAPFPPAIPELLIAQMEQNHIVLDPYSGSMTTGRTAFRKGVRSLSIELHRHYCEIGLKLLQQDADDSPLFRGVVW